MTSVTCLSFVILLVVCVLHDHVTAMPKELKSKKTFDYKKQSRDADDVVVSLPLACGEGEFKCLSNGRCIPANYVCDGDTDCRDNSDELNCGRKKRKMSKKAKIFGQRAVRQCANDEFQCGDGSCISNEFVCDEDADCDDFSDESKCECTGGRVWNECGSLCVPTCAEPNQAQVCTAMCMPGCQCPPDRPLWQNEQCISYSQCP